MQGNAGLRMQITPFRFLRANSVPIVRSLKWNVSVILSILDISTKLRQTSKLICKIIILEAASGLQL